MKQMFLAGLGLVAWGALSVTPASATVTLTDMFRDARTFARIEPVGGETIFESHADSSIAGGAYNTTLLSEVSDDQSEVRGRAIQFSQLSERELRIQAAIQTFGATDQAGAVLEGFGSTRLLVDFHVSTTTPTSVSGFVFGNGEGQALATLLGPNVSLNFRGENGLVQLDESLLLQPGTYRLEVETFGSSNVSDDIDQFATGELFVSIEFESTADVELPNVLDFKPTVFPNPTRSATQIRLDVEHSDSGPVIASVIDANGRSVRTLVLTGESRGTGGARSLQAFWNLEDERGERVPAGVYYVRAAGAAPVKTVVLR